jgi:uncharacterized protein YndB with AHSA1/START domain
MTTIDIDGTLEPAGERWRLRFTRHLPQSTDKVWRAITEPEHLAAWFPQRIVGEWSVGAPLKFVSEFGDFDGEVLAYEPPHFVEFRWGTDVIRLEVTPEDGGTMLTLLDTLVELGTAARSAAGWWICLAALEAELVGQKPASPRAEDFKAINRRFAEKFGPEAATIGPPADWEAKTQARSRLT